MRISFLGDISLNDNYIELYKKGIDPFKEVGSLLSSSDFVIGNLESMVKGEYGVNLLKNPRLTTTVETLNYLRNIHLNVACLANNHVYDHLEDGFNKTTQYLNENGILHVGAGHSLEEVSKPIILNKNGISVALLNYVTNDTNPNLPKDTKVFLNFFDIEKCKEDIGNFKQKVNHIVLLLHWGGRVEGGLYPDWDQPKIARELIDAGADLIVGHHSHTTQPYEIYKGKYIFYSLGNFCFSDVIIDGKALPLDKKRTNSSVILNIKFHQSEYLTSIIGIINDKDIIKTNEKYKMKKILTDRFMLYRFPIWNFYFFCENRIYPIVHYFFGNRRNPFKQLIKLKWKSILKHSIGF